MLKALIVDPDPRRAETLRLILEFLEYESAVVTAPAAWRAAYDAMDHCDVVLLAPCDGGGAVLGAYRDIRAHDQELPIVALRDPALEGPGDREVDGSSVASVALPVRHSDLQHALHQVEIYRENRHLSDAPRSPELFRNLVGSSKPVRTVRRLIEQVAKTDATVLLLGESGTGKEVVARNLHYHSGRRYKPFVPVNCG
ncbi:MAG: sigma 54-interacting transcriptional regulator, partial [Gammaproteobacteria bacterium]|nr:sigma 54-interacting transcriptional regulator [Gammaproteobacteria bacterium]